MIQATFTTNEVASLARTTKRTVQLWCEAGWLSCDIISARRAFNEQTALLACVLAELREKGFGPADIRRFLYPIRRAVSQLDILGSRGDIHYLLFSGTHCPIATCADSVVAFATAQRLPVTVVDLRQIARRVEIAASRVDPPASRLNIRWRRPVPEAAAAPQPGGFC